MRLHFWYCSLPWHSAIAQTQWKAKRAPDWSVTQVRTPPSSLPPLTPLITSCSVLIGCLLTQSLFFQQGQLAMCSSQNTIHLWGWSQPKKALAPIDPNQSIVEMGFDCTQCITCTIHPHWELNARGTVDYYSFSTYFSISVISSSGNLWTRVAVT